MSALITPARLYALLCEKQDVVVLDASWYLPAMARDADQEFARAAIPGAQRMNIDGEWARKDTDLPHMLVDANSASVAGQKLGINKASIIVVYDAMGMFSAARAWWTFRAYGHEQCFVLDGGLKAWVKQGYPVSASQALQSPPATGDWSASAPDKRWVVGIDDLDSANTHLLDARPYERFSGQAAEPRAGLASGHIPGSHSLPFSQVVDNGRLRNSDALAALYARFDDSKDLVMTCGSGVTASILSLAYYQTGRGIAAVYDGSWAEYGASKRPVASC